jgi:hypothetical protein
VAVKHYQYGSVETDIYVNVGNVGQQHTQLAWWVDLIGTG